MIDRGVMTEETVLFPAVPPLEPTVDTLAPLEQRVRRLEDAVASLQDTRQLEERVAARVAERVGRGSSSSADVLLSAGKHLLPAALGVLHEQEQCTDAAGTVETRRTWLILDAYAEGRAAVRMYLDPRYRPYMRWTARVVPLLLLALILTSQWLMPWTLVPVVGTVLDKAVCILLAFLAFKILCREARRYREMIP